MIQENSQNWLIISVLYASYNCILLIPILTSMKEYINKSKEIKKVALIVSVILTILLITVFLFLINIDVDIKKIEMPAVYAINNIWPQIKNIYGIIILISIFTTAISLGMSFLKNISINNKSYNIIAILICSSAVVFSKIGFSNLVNIMYPILGFFGLLQITKIVLQK